MSSAEGRWPDGDPPQGAEDVDHFDAGLDQSVRLGRAGRELVERTMEYREIERLIGARIVEGRDCAADGDRGARRGAQRPYRLPVQLRHDAQMGGLIACADEQRGGNRQCLRREADVDDCVMNAIDGSEARAGDYRFHPSQSQIARPITSSRSRPFSQGSSSVNSVTH